VAPDVHHVPHIPHPSLEDFVFEGEETPLLLRRSVVLGIVAAFVLLLIGYFVFSIRFGFSWDLNAKPFKEWVDGFGAWGPIVFIVAMALSVLIAPIPNSPIFIAAGLAWGPIIGSIYSMAGLMLGSSMAFYVSRWLGRGWLPRLIGGKAAARIDQIADTMGGRVIFWARMVPAINFDWISFIAGLTSIRFTPFFIYSFLGFLFPTSLTVAAGDGLAHDVRITIALTGLWVLAIAATAGFFWFQRRRWAARRARAARESAQGPTEMGSLG
jgi:uncharacterized membrane protein YdjX (TVP38/TMEM64 family)